MIFDKYEYYRRSVQAPEADVVFFRNLYRKLRNGKNPRFLREDFCGTFANLCEWVKLDKLHHGVGVDLDLEPLEYGIDNYLDQLSEDQITRIHLHRANVLSARVEPADIIIALNFSYYLFKSRDTLLRYFRCCRRGLKARGLFIVDAFGGPACMFPNTEKTRRRGYWYLWDQKTFDPVTNEAKFAIHFKRDGEKIRKNVFTYNWRMWTVPELKDTLMDAGFKSVEIYWEKDNGQFSRVVSAKPEEAWIAYLVASPA